MPKQYKISSNTRDIKTEEENSGVEYFQRVAKFHLTQIIFDVHKILCGTSVLIDELHCIEVNQ